MIDKFSRAWVSTYYLNILQVATRNPQNISLDINTTLYYPLSSQDLPSDIDFLFIFRADSFLFSDQNTILLSRIKEKGGNNYGKS